MSRKRYSDEFKVETVNQVTEAEYRLVNGLILNPPQTPKNYLTLQNLSKFTTMSICIGIPPWSPAGGL
jgi:hypothetical protein